MEKQQTAVEFLVEFMSKNQYFIGNDLLQAINQSKEMEKEQKEALYTAEQVEEAMQQISEYIIEAVDLDATQSAELEPFVKAEAKSIIKSLKTTK